MSFVALSALRRAAGAAAPMMMAGAPRPPVTSAINAGQRRLMGGGGGRPWADKQGPYYGHFHISPWHKYPAIAYCTVMWLWMMYRAKQDGAWVLGIIHPWDAH